MSRYTFRTIFITLGLVTLLCSISSPTANAAPNPRRVWRADQIIAERDLSTPDKKRPRYCQGGVFKPCVCAKDVTKSVQYRPAVRECRGRAAVILSGKYTSAFSAVVRDKENKDRWPPEGANNCTAHERDVLALNKCSVFKVQEIIGVDDDSGDAEVHCLGASGYSKLFRRVSRITIKISDIPNSNEDPLARLCLVGPAQPLN